MLYFIGGFVVGILVVVAATVVLATMYVPRMFKAAPPSEGPNLMYPVLKTKKPVPPDNYKARKNEMDQRTREILEEIDSMVPREDL